MSPQNEKLGTRIKKWFYKAPYITTSRTASQSWLEARVVENNGPVENQLWRVNKFYTHGYFSDFEGQMTFAKMLETLKDEELKIAKDAGMTGTDLEIAAARLSVVNGTNVLRVIADGKLPERKPRLNSTRILLSTLALAFAAAIGGNMLTSSESPAAVKAPESMTATLATPEGTTTVTVGQTPVEKPVVAVQEAPLKGTVSFDYSTQSGEYHVGSGDKSFTIRFSKADDTAIYVYRDRDTEVARVKNAGPYDDIKYSDYDSSSRVYAVQTGEIFMLKNAQGYYMQARIQKIEDDTRGPNADKVVFEYEINPVKGDTFQALPMPKDKYAIVKAPAAGMKP